MPFLGTFGAGTVRSFGRGASVAAPPAGPTYEVLNFVGNNGCLTITNNNTTTVDIAKTGCSNNWDTHAYVATPYTAPITVEFQKQADSGDNGASYAMISLNEDPATNASYDTLDYAAYPYQTASWRVYNNGSFVGDYSSWNPSLISRISYRTDGGLYHYNGSTLIFSTAWGAGRTVYIDTSFYSVNGTYSRFYNIKAIKQAWNGTNYF